MITFRADYSLTICSRQSERHYIICPVRLCGHTNSFHWLLPKTLLRFANGEHLSGDVCHRNEAAFHGLASDRERIVMIVERAGGRRHIYSAAAVVTEDSFTSAKGPLSHVLSRGSTSLANKRMLSSAIS